MKNTINTDLRKYHCLVKWKQDESLSCRIFHRLSIHQYNFVVQSAVCIDIVLANDIAILRTHFHKHSKTQKITCNCRFLLTPFPVVFRSDVQCIKKIDLEKKQVILSHSFFCRICFPLISIVYLFPLKPWTKFYLSKNKKSAFLVRLSEKCDMMSKTFFYTCCVDD